MIKNTTSLIQSLDRGLKILEVVSNSNSPVTLTELTEKLNIDRSSVFRLANTLRQRGFLTHAAGSKDYVLGTIVWRMANNYPWIQTLVQISSKYLKALAADTRETVHMAIRQGTKTLIIDNEMSNHPLNVTVQTGDEGLLHCTSVGKALIADYTKEDLLDLLNKKPLKPLTKKTITSIDVLAEECYKVKDVGYSVDDEEYFNGIRCVAAPIRDATSTIIAALGVSAPKDRMDNRMIKITGEKVKNTALKISSVLGYSLIEEPVPEFI